MDRRFFLAAIAVALLSSLTNVANAELVPETVVEGSGGFWSVAVQPETGHVFVSQGGLARIVRVIDGKLQEVVVDFPAEAFGESASPQIGPMGLTFVSRNVLAIGGSGQSDSDMIYVVRVPPVGSDPIALADALRFRSSTADSESGLHRISGIIRAPAEFGSPPEALIATWQGPGTGAVVVLPVRNSNELDQPTGYGQINEYAYSDTKHEPVSGGITLSPRRELVVSYGAATGSTERGRLVFHQLTNGMRLLDLDARIGPITALSYGAPVPPANQRSLYALAASGSDSDPPGLYRLDAALDAGAMSIRPRHLAALNRPTAMAWGGDGALYVTLLVDNTADAAMVGGRLVRFGPGL